MGKSNNHGDAKSSALALLDELSVAASRRTHCATDADEDTEQFRRPAAFDPLQDWLEGDDHRARLIAIANSVLPGRVARRSCSDETGARASWRDPIEGLQDQPGSLVVPWSWAQGHGYEACRADLLAIAAELRRRIDAGAPVPSVSVAAAAAAAPIDPPAGRWMRKAEAARAARISVERLRSWCTRERNPLPTRWEGGTELVNLDDVLRECHAKTERAKHTEAHAPTTRRDTDAHAVPKRPRRGPQKR